MSNFEQDPACAAIQPLLFAAIEGEVDRRERLEVHAHLAICEPCRSWERGERALTALLTDGRATAAAKHRVRSRFVTCAAALSITSLVLLVLPSATPRGSLVQRHLGPGLDWEVASERALAGKDVVTVPAAAAATVRLGDSVQLDSVGPARFALEVIGRRWCVSVLDGTVLATVDAHGTIATGSDPSRALDAGHWLLSAAGVARQAPSTQALQPQDPEAQEPTPRDTAWLLAEGLQSFGAAMPAILGGSQEAERRHLAAAERLLRAVLAAKDVTVAQTQRAMFYLAASLSRQGRNDESFELETEWLRRFPDGGEASLVRFYMADYLRQNSRMDEARALFERVRLDEGDSSLGSAARSYLEVMPRGQDSRPQDPARRDLESMLTEGLDRFGLATHASLGGKPEVERQHLVAAERLLRAVLAAKDASAAQQQRSMFYLAASLSRQGRNDESFALETEWLKRFPDGAEAGLVRFYMAEHLRQNGRTDEARALFERVLRDEGNSSLASATRTYLEFLDGGQPMAPSPARSASPQDPPAERLSAKRAAPAAATDAKRSAYLVIPVELAPARTADAGYLAAARAARDFHGGDEWAWDGQDFDALGRQLRERSPENVLFVLRPEQLDLVLHRRVLLLSAGIDDDWFVDFAFGYLTGENGAACQRLWQRIETVRDRGKLGGVWWQASVTSNKTSLEYENAPPALAAAAGFRGPHYYYSTANEDRTALIERSLATMPSASVVEITGCGDPQGIWLFDDQRNMKRELHWDYAAERVGADPVSMPRLLASRFRELELDAPILWSGTCHSGAVCRVFVEGDIVSTFGRTQRATVHRLQPHDSLALSWLAAGAASMLVPLGANHGMSVSMEVDFALRHGASLGETMKSTYDDVLLAAEGKLVLDLPVEGGPHLNREPVMQGGGSNRILIGDPSLRPFRRVDSAAEVVTVERTPTGLRVTVERAEGWQPRAWDMFGGARGRDYRVLTRVDLGAAGLLDRTDFEAGVTARDPKGTTLPYAMSRLAIEDHHGRRYLHLQANGARGDLDRKAATIVFDVLAK